MQERGEGETGARTGRRLPAGGAVHLASREDFSLGRASIRPSLRTVEGPSGSFVIEPRVMQVLVAFADANGAVHGVSVVRQHAQPEGSRVGLENLPGLLVEGTVRMASYRDQGRAQRNAQRSPA